MALCSLPHTVALALALHHVHALTAVVLARRHDDLDITRELSARTDSERKVQQGDQRGRTTA